MARVPVTYSLRSLAARRWATTATALGLALVVFVFTAVLMMSSGIEHTLASTGAAGNVKLLGRAERELESAVTPDELRQIAAYLAGDGAPLVAPETVALIFAARGAGTDDDGANLTVRGLGEHGPLLHRPSALDGRWWRAGTSEVVIGRALAGRFAGMQLGGQLAFARRTWTVVGVMDQAGSGFDSEIWGDVEEVQDAFARRPNFSSVTARLRPGALPALRARLAADPATSGLRAVAEVDYWAAQSRDLSGFIRFFGGFVAVVCALGAALGAMITMAAQVRARTREIGALRALGFSRSSVLWAFTLESLLLAAGAGALGLGAAALLGRVSFSTLNAQSFSEITFRFHFTAQVAAAALGFALAIGGVGGLFPALAAARLRIVDATRGA
jgi:cell division protein FtsX